MKKKISMLLIICIVPMGYLGCSQGTINEDLKKSTNEKSHEIIKKVNYAYIRTVKKNMLMYLI